MPNRQQRVNERRNVLAALDAGNHHELILTSDYCSEGNTLDQLFAGFTIALQHQAVAIFQQQNIDTSFKG